MLRLWLTLYYGYWLFLLGNINSIGVRAQTQIPTQVPSWYFGNSVKFVRYNDQQCSQLATSDYPSPTSAIFGGLRYLSVPLRTDNCIKVPSIRFGWPSDTYIRFIFNGYAAGQTYICHLGNAHMDWGTNIYMWAGPNAQNCMGAPSGTFQLQDPTALFMKDIDSCVRDNGDSQNALFYRAFCDIAYPNSTTTVHTTTQNTVVNNITHYVTNVVPAPLNVSAITDIVRANIPPPPPPVSPEPAFINATKITEIVKASIPPINMTELYPMVNSIVNEKLFPLFLALAFRQLNTSSSPPPSPPPTVRAAVFAQNNTEASKSAAVAIGVGWLALYVGAAYSFFMYVLFCISTLFAIASASFFCSSNILPYFPVR